MTLRLVILFVLSSLVLSTTAVEAVVTFTEVVPPLHGGDRGEIAWGDYDQDGDLDLLVTAATGSGYPGVPILRLYQNNSGSFVSVLAGLPAASDGPVAWGDYDGDGDLDLLLAGDSASSGRITRIYRNTAGTFADIQAGLPGVSWGGSAAWGDCDNDGDLDLALTGSTGSGFISRVYRNDGGVFRDLAAGLPGVYGSSTSWGDYDDDGDLDLLLTGRSALGALTRLYRNDGASFVDVHADIPNFMYSAAAWGDCDADGDLDLAISGTIGSPANPACRVYRNSGGNFNLMAELPHLQHGSVEWGDYDNDGDLDLLASGWRAGQPQMAFVHANTGSGFDLMAQVPGGYEGAWADYDGDGDLDMVLGGDGPTRIHRNDGALPNVLPNTPTGLTSTVGETEVTLSWAAATDAETQQDGLSYNLRIGTTPGGSQIMAPMSNTTSGYRRVAALGNTQQKTSWTITMPPAGGTFYWSVQAVDAELAGSPFAPEQSFVMTSGCTDASTMFSSWDGTAEDAYSWNFAGAPAGYGHLAECYSGTYQLTSVRLVLTRIAISPAATIDVYVWEDDGGVPGDVIAMVPGVNPAPVGIWPEWTTLYIPLPPGVIVEGTWWVGYRPNIPELFPPCYIGADLDGPVRTCPYTNVAPGMILPSGWQPAELIWPGLQSFAIGACGTTDTGALATIRGRVFEDLNADCLQGGGETALGGRRVLMEPLDRVATTTPLGNYTFGFVPPGTHSLRLLPPDNWEQDCPAGGAPLVVTVVRGQTSNGNNFGSRRIPGVQDLYVWLSAGPARPGFETSYSVNYENRGATTLAGTVTLTLPAEVSFTQCSAAGVYDVPTHTVVWALGSLTPGSAGLLTAEGPVAVATPLGTWLASSAVIAPVAGDTHPANNSAAATQEVVGSFDPNQKLVTPREAIAGTEVLRYHIDFQNVGTADAINIVVRDTLDSGLDMSTVRFGGGSHAHVPTMNGRVLTWTFNGIDLPDSTSDEPHSHGYVEFTAQPQPGLPEWTEIVNSAAIYFDFNPAVITNLVINTIAGATGVDPGAQPQAPGGPAIPVRFALHPCFPNPFNPRTTIRYDVPHSGAVVSIDIFDVGGRLVRTLVRGAVAAGTHEVTWDGRDGGGATMPSGVYFSRFQAGGFSQTRKLVLTK